MLSTLRMKNYLFVAIAIFTAHASSCGRGGDSGHSRGANSEGMTSTNASKWVSILPPTRNRAAKRLITITIAEGLGVRHPGKRTVPMGTSLIELLDSEETLPFWRGKWLITRMREGKQVPVFRLRSRRSPPTEWSDPEEPDDFILKEGDQVHFKAVFL